MKTQTKAGKLRVEMDSVTTGLSIFLDNTGELLLIAGGAPMLPVIDGAKLAVSGGKWQERASDSGPLWETCLIPLPESPVRNVKVFLQPIPEQDALDLWCEFTAGRDCQLNALDLFPAKTGVNLYDVVNFRNRHFTANTWPELLIGQGCTTTTYSNDWQFAPHPTALLLRKNTVSLFAGFLDLQASFGMRLSVKKSVVEQWDVDFGQSPHGLPLAQGERFRSGRLRLFLRQDRTVCEMYSEFGQMLVREGRIPDPAHKVRYDWWREPIYCTWGDQWMLGNHQPAVDLGEQTASESAPATDQLSEALIHDAVAVIKKERLPVRTIILDEGWAVARGDWRPHPKFSNFRKLVDDLHAQGFKVMVWWNWAEIAADAQVEAGELAGAGWLNRHGNRWRDYSDPAVQENYLKPLFRKFFSAEPDCYDLDGVKTDFLADKVHPETPVHDPSWRGEETYFVKLTEMFYREMRQHKADAMHLGCAGHYWLAEFIDLNRTYDVASSNWLEHEARAHMLMCTSPGTVISYDMMTCAENTERWFASARSLGAGVELGNVLACRPDNFSPVIPADAAYWAMLRQGCEGA
ncbi:MAG: TIM-barrel domain-containing protein [Chthoniobacteraceae bacterium]